MSDAGKLRDASPWHPIDNKVDLKHLGKLAEELSECSGAAAGCLFFGSRNGTMRYLLQLEVADVRANLDLVAARFDLMVRPLFQDNKVLPPCELAPIGDTDHDHLVAFIKRLGDCGSAVSRCIIQGVDECEPVSGKPNRTWLRETAAAAWAMTELIIARFAMNEGAIVVRATKKMAYQRQWHALP